MLGQQHGPGSSCRQQRQDVGAVLRLAAAMAGPRPVREALSDRLRWTEMFGAASELLLSLLMMCAMCLRQQCLHFAQAVGESSLRCRSAKIANC